MKLVNLTLTFTLIAVIVTLSDPAFSQTNKIQDTGYVGIGTINPTGKLHVLENARNYYVNKAITGTSEDSQGINYILLHPSYNNQALGSHYVMGSISAIRGNTVSWNRKWLVEVNSSSAFTTDRASLTSHFEPAYLVTLYYGGTKYLAVSVANNSLIYGFSFTGYAENETFKIVKDEEVSNVSAFNGNETILLQSKLNIYSDTANILLEKGTSWFKRPNSYVKMNLDDNYPVIAYEQDAAYNNFISLEHAAYTQSNLCFGNTNASYSVINQRNSNIIESQRDLHIGATLSGKIIFEVGRSGTTVNSAMVIANNKNVGIGVDNPNYKLTVNGTIGARKVKVTQETWADYVFDASYQLPSLQNLRRYITEHKHLPGVPSEKEVKVQGIDLGQMNKILLSKVEELTLYILELEKRNQDMKADFREKMEDLSERISALEQNKL